MVLRTRALTGTKHWTEPIAASADPAGRRRATLLISGAGAMAFAHAALQRRVGKCGRTVALYPRPGAEWALACPL